MSIYLDYNSSAPIDDRVLDYMMDIYKNVIGNADSRTHNFGEKARQIVENAREQVASILNVKKDYYGPEKEFSWLDEKTVIVENYIGKKRRQLYSPYYSFAFLGEGDTVIDQVPRQGERIGEGGQVMILLGY